MVAILVLALIGVFVFAYICLLAYFWRLTYQPLRRRGHVMIFLQYGFEDEC